MVSNVVILKGTRRRGSRPSTGYSLLSASHDEDGNTETVPSAQGGCLDQTTGAALLGEVVRTCDAALGYFERKGDREGQQRMDNLATALVSMIAEDLERNDRI